MLRSGGTWMCWALLEHDAHQMCLFPPSKNWMPNISQCSHCAVWVIVVSKKLKWNLDQCVPLVSLSITCSTLFLHSLPVQENLSWAAVLLLLFFKPPVPVRLTDWPSFCTATCFNLFISTSNFSLPSSVSPSAALPCLPQFSRCHNHTNLTNCTLRGSREGWMEG